MIYGETRSKHGEASEGSASGPFLGDRPPRTEGVARIAGAVPCAIAPHLDRMAFAVTVQSTIAASRVCAIDTAAAEAAPGVLLVLTPWNIQALKTASSGPGVRPSEAPYNPPACDVTFAGQHVVAVVAETPEQATAAAALLRVDYAPAPATAGLDDPNAGDGLAVDRLTAAWGDADAALAAAPVRIDRAYRTPCEYDEPIEPHGLIARWEGDALTVWAPGQRIDGMARTYAEWLGIPFESVRLVSPALGGGFGSKALALAHGALAAVAARLLDRPVKLALTRPQAVTGDGGRPATRQAISLGATDDGRLIAIAHRGAAADGTAVGPLGSVPAIMYATPSFSSRQTVVRVNHVLPEALRAPAEIPGAFAIESAIDELAYEVGMDPLAIRLRNDAQTDRRAGKPWSTRRLREAFAAGAAAFGWSKRSPLPRSMRDGGALIGWGVAAGTCPMRRTAGEIEDRYDDVTGIAPTDGDYSLHSWCAHFVEVRVDEGFGTVRVARVVSAFDSGWLPNPRLAESQWKAGIIMGIGQALPEAAATVDPCHAHVVSNDLVATSAGIPDIETISVGIFDPHSSALGGKPVAGLGVVGVAPAIANAIYHATGKRVRDLPITIDKLL